MSKKATSHANRCPGFAVLWFPPPGAARWPARTSGCSISRSRCRPISRRRPEDHYLEPPSVTSGCRSSGRSRRARRRSALDPPSDDEVMRALEKARPVQGGLPFLARNPTEQRADRGRADRRLHRSAAGVSAGRARPAPSRPLQVHRLLHRGHARRLADPVHEHATRTPRGDLHRPRPSAHGGERGSGAGQQLLSGTALPPAA